MPSILSDIHAMLMDDGYAYWSGAYHKSGTAWRLVFRGGWRLEAI